MGRLDELDLRLQLKRARAGRAARGRAASACTQLRLHARRADRRRHELGPPLCVLFEGWDASGKGGAIKRLVLPLDPRHVRVASFAAPTPTRSATTSCGASAPALPGWGGMAVLDRSWYGRVLVERVEGFATEESGSAPTPRSSASSARWPPRA